MVRTMQIEIDGAVMEAALRQSRLSYALTEWQRSRRREDGRHRGKKTEELAGLIDVCSGFV